MTPARHSRPSDPADLLAELVTRLAPEIDATFARHGVTDPALREQLIAGAAQEVLWRRHRTPDPTGRLLRSLDRRCQEIDDATEGEDR